MCFPVSLILLKLFWPIQLFLYRKFDSSYVENRKDKRIKPIIIDELLNQFDMFDRTSYIGVQIILSFLKEDFLGYMMQV